MTLTRFHVHPPLKTKAQRDLDKARRAANQAIGDARADRLVALLMDRGMECPTREYSFHPTRKWRFDLAWPDGRIAIEIDGGTYAGKPCAICKRRAGGRHNRGDREKVNAAQAAGWRVLSFDSAMIDSGLRECADAVMAVLEWQVIRRLTHEELSAGMATTKV